MKKQYIIYGIIGLVLAALAYKLFYKKADALSAAPASTPGGSILPGAGSPSVGGGSVGGGGGSILPGGSGPANVLVPVPTSGPVSGPAKAPVSSPPLIPASPVVAPGASAPGKVQTGTSSWLPKGPGPIMSPLGPTVSIFPKASPITYVPGPKKGI